MLDTIVNRASLQEELEFYHPDKWYCGIGTFSGKFSSALVYFSSQRESESIHNKSFNSHDFVDVNRCCYEHDNLLDRGMVAWKVRFT